MTGPRDFLAMAIRANAESLISDDRMERDRAMRRILAAVDRYVDSPDPAIDDDFRADAEAAWRRSRRLNNYPRSLCEARLEAAAREAYGRSEDSHDEGIEDVA